MNDTSPSSHPDQSTNPSTDDLAAEASPLLSQALCVRLPLGDRWQILNQLAALDVTAACHPDGSLQVAITSPLAAIQLWSVLQREHASRTQQLDWLERCWANAA